MKKVLLALIVTALVFSCKKSDKKAKDDTTSTPEKAELTSAEIKQILDSNLVVANAAWDSAMAADDNKMADIKRLLDEISYTESSDEKRLKELYIMFDEVKQMRYTQDNITGERIDAYDEAQSKLITETNQLAESTPNIESHPLAIELMSDIVDADGMTFSKRADYDTYAKRINRVIKAHPEKLKDLGAPYSNMEKIGIFGFEN